MLLYNDFAEISIGELVLGTNLKKELLNTKDVEKILDTFFDVGGMCIDTARNYGSGVCEIYIGRWLRKKSIRDKIILSTKAGHPLNSSNSRLTKKEIENDLHNSFKALKTDYIDLLWLHRDDLNIPVEVIIDYMNSFVKDGKVRMFGASNWSFSRIQEANDYARISRKIGFSCSQIQWSVARPCYKYYNEQGLRSMNRYEYENYLSSGFPLFAYSPQAKGFFYYLESQRELGYRQQLFNNEKNIKIMVILTNLAKKYKVPLNYVVLSFILSSPLNAIPIIGCRSYEDVIDCFSAKNFKLQPEEYELLLDL